MRDLEGKTAFITGGASGIGLGMAHAFAGAGMKVMLGDIEKPALDRAAAELRAANAAVDTVQCDVSDMASMRAAAAATLESFGKVHVLCNNAGVSSGGLVEELDDGDWGWVIGVNFLGVLNGCRAFIPHIKRHGEGGHVVNTSSMAGLLGGMAGWGPYNSTKFAVVGLTEVLRQEGRAGGYGASVLCPGGVNTNIYEAPRNRPQRFGPQVSKVAMEDIRSDLKQGLDPKVVGRLVLEAVRENRLYVFTDPRFRKMVEQRHQHLLADFEWAAASQALNDAHAPGSKSAKRGD
jgi:NAD(P)-dependent dehydrogenase (short-subunit alcohol dehydrogenase family)